MTELRTEPYIIPAANLGPENPLPHFRTAEDMPVHFKPDVPQEDRRYMGWKVANRVLPHRMQDSFDRNKKPREFRSVVLENDYLKARFLPELGGRMVSLIHKPADRELLDRNPVFQPANLALRNAWFSGGIEWNTSHFGHYYLTCSPIFAAQIKGTQGEPVLRLYEWDRVKCFPWQIDFHLPPDSQFMFARVRLINPYDHEIPMYWWTNMAVEERPGTRTLCPAEDAIHNTPGAFGLVRLPELDGVDVTYSTNIQHSKEFFFRIPDKQRRWITALDKEGRGFVQTSTDRLRGRKMFVWGVGQGGTRWQEYLAAPGKAYIEIQAGLAKTQVECVPMPAKTEWTWTEAYGLLEADPAQVHSKDWNKARQTVETALESAIPRADVEEYDREFASVTVRPPEAILAQGSGWGALEKLREKEQGETSRIPSELPFDDSTLGPDQQPWLELLQTGVLPERDPQDEPGHYMVQPQWQEMLEKSVSTGKGGHWLSWLHLGVMRCEAFDTEGAQQAWEKSLEDRENAWALRNLATLENRSKNHKRALDLLLRAWRVGPQIAPLALEIAQQLMHMQDYEGLRKFIRNLPEDIRQYERLTILSATAALKLSDLSEVEKLFDRELATVREGEVTLTDLWFEMHERRIAASEGIPMDEALRQRVRRDFPPPAHIDFRASA